MPSYLERSSSGSSAAQGIVTVAPAHSLTTSRPCTATVGRHQQTGAGREHAPMRATAQAQECHLRPLQGFPLQTKTQRRLIAGAATSLTLAGASIETVRHLGRWRSFCVHKYVPAYPDVIRGISSLIYRRIGFTLAVLNLPSQRLEIEQ